MITLFDAALDYARRGFFLFPCYEITPDGDCACPRGHPNRGPDGRCARPGKHPRTRHGFKDATTDPKVVNAWWAEWPHANISVDCGRSGLLVPDVDPRNGGDTTMADRERRHGPLPDTPRQLTGGGGVHHLLKRPTWPNVRSVEGGLGCGIDLKCDGGYILVAPSNHVSGGRYHWEIGYGLDDLPIAAPPDWILRALEEHRDSGAGRLRADGTPLELREGDRNRRLFQIGCALRRYGANERALLACLDAINREHARPPLTENELALIAKSAANYASTACDLRPQFRASRRRIAIW
jgi:putative DNA primase/helicase